MTIINIHQAKTQLSRLVEQAAAGEEIVIAKAGQPRARLVPMEKPAARMPGAFAGDIEMGDTFFDPLPESELADWEGAASGG